MKRNELDKVAEEFAVDTKDVKNKTELIERLTDEGVTFKEWEKMQKVNEEEMELASATTLPADVDEPEVESNEEPSAENTFLVKMERQNPSYDAIGKTFTSKHPFMVCTKEEVDRLMYEHTGFRMATPQEVEEYYS